MEHQLHSVSTLGNSEVYNINNDPVQEAVKLYSSKISDKVVHLLSSNAPWSNESKERMSEYGDLIAEFESGKGTLQETKKDAPKDYENGKKFDEYLDKVTTDPSFFRTFLECSSEVVCMDGGIHGNHLRAEGGGILTERNDKNMKFPNSGPYAKLKTTLSTLEEEMKMYDPSVSLPFEWADEEDYSVLLPTESQLDTLQEQVARGVLTKMHAHADCGAAKVDIMRVLHFQLAHMSFATVEKAARALGYHQEERERVRYEDFILACVMKRVPQKYIDEHAQIWTKTVANTLKIPHGYITEEQIERVEGKHTEVAMYMDMVGGGYDGLAFDPKIVGLPSGFIYHPKITSWERALRKIPVALSIAFGDHGPGKEFFSEERPFQIVLLEHPMEGQKKHQHPVYGSISEGTLQVEEMLNAIPSEYKKFVKIHRVAPFQNTPESFDRVLDFGKKELQTIQKNKK